MSGRCSLAVYMLGVLVAACSSKQPPAPPADAGLEDAREVPDPDADLPHEPLDAATCGNGNPGSGICNSVADCPPEDACWSWRCEDTPVGKRCVATVKDGGP